MVFLQNQAHKKPVLQTVFLQAGQDTFLINSTSKLKMWKWLMRLIGYIQQPMTKMEEYYGKFIHKISAVQLQK